MAGYVIAYVNPTDADGMATYREGVGPSIEAFGGKYIAAGGEFEVMEGDASPAVVAIIEFPSLAKVKEWYASEEYAEMKALRLRSAKTTVVFTEGL